MRNPILGSFILVLGVMATACAQPKPDDPMADPVADPVPVPAPGPAPSEPPVPIDEPNAEPAPQPTTPETIALKPETPVTVSGTDLTMELVSSWHKTSAPVNGFEVRFTLADHTTEVGWRIEEGEFDGEWRPMEGRYYEPDTSEYVEDTIAGWEVKMVSLDETDAGGSPALVTLAVRKAE